MDSENFNANCEKILKIIASANADLIVFPEAASSGFNYPRIVEIAGINDILLSRACLMAKSVGKSVVLPLIIREGKDFVNRSHFIGATGEIIAIYDKIHLIGVLHEDRFLKAGVKTVAGQLQTEDQIVRLGLATCYDLRFPELFRHLAINEGVDIFVLPSMWPVERAEHLSILSQARAVENQTPLILCNGTGICGNINLCGTSAVYDSRGRLLARASVDSEEQLDVEIDLNDTRQWRIDFPVLSDATVNLLLPENI